jgi:hypothetical protein
MPLLDHFHPPLSTQRHWESFHAAWIAWISDTLNRVLPDGYFAEEQTHAGASVEIDIGTFETAGGVAVSTATWTAPAPSATFPAVLANDFEVKVFSTRGGSTLVAAVELVSPGNKDRPEARRAFATKCASYLHQGVALVVVDVVTERHANLHHHILDLFGQPVAGRLFGDPSLYAVAYRPIRRGEQTEIDVWPVALAIGGPLPTLPLWLNAVSSVPLELETTYTEICRRRRIAG